MGLHKTAYLPTFRGFDSFYGYYEGSEDYFTHNFYGNGLDFHREEGQRCGAGCSELLWDEVGNYSTNLFAQRAVDKIRAHDADRSSLFLYLAFQGVHEPRQAPASYVQPYAESIADPGRREFAGMLSALDEGMANVTAALKAKGMYDDVLFIVTTE